MPLHLDYSAARNFLSMSMKNALDTATRYKIPFIAAGPTGNIYTTMNSQQLKDFKEQLDSQLKTTAP